MAYPVQIGQSLNVGGQTAVTGYIITSERTGPAQRDEEDIDTTAGAFSTRIIFKQQDRASLEIIAHSGYTGTEFTEGTICGATPWSLYFVQSTTPTKTKGALRLAVELINLGSTIVTSA